MIGGGAVGARVADVMAGPGESFVHGQLRFRALDRWEGRFGGRRGGLDADDVVGRLERRLLRQRLPGVGPPGVSAHDRRVGVGVDDRDLGEAEADRPRQELAVEVEAHRRTGVARPGQDQLGRTRLVRTPGPDGDPAVEVHGRRRVQLVGPGELLERLRQERGVLGIELKPCGRAPGIGECALDVGEAGVGLDLQEELQRPTRRTTCVSVLPSASGSSRGSSRQAKTGDRRIRTSPDQGKRKPDWTRSWRPSVATTWWSSPRARSWRQLRA